MNRKRINLGSITFDTGRVAQKKKTELLKIINNKENINNNKRK